MLTDATLDYPFSSFPELEIKEATPTIPSQSHNGGMSRARDLQKNIENLSGLLTQEQTHFQATLNEAVHIPKVRFRESIPEQTVSTEPRRVFISWLLDLKAWGDETEQLKANVEELLALKKGWDGEGAEPIHPLSVKSACDFIDRLGQRSREFEPFADPNGLVGLEAHKPDKAAYLSFFRDGLVAYVFRVGNAVHRANKTTHFTAKQVLDAVF